MQKKLVTREQYFPQTCGFSRTIKVNKVHPLNQKKLHINGLNILQNPKDPILAVFLSIIPKTSFFF